MALGFTVVFLDDVLFHLFEMILAKGMCGGGTRLGNSRKIPSKCQAWIGHPSQTAAPFRQDERRVKKLI